VGVYVGNAIRRHHARRGIRILSATDVLAVEQASGATASVILLDDGALTADLVIECTGSQPDVDWLDGNELDLADGVLCNPDLSVVGQPRAIAVGDVARFPNARFGGPATRISCQRLGDAARHGANTLLASVRGEPARSGPFTPIPRFGSRQGDLRITVCGVPALADRKRVVRGELNGGLIIESVVVEYFRGRELIGVVTINTPVSEQTVHHAKLTNAPATVARPEAGVLH
jgi:hypothetical protein